MNIFRKPAFEKKGSVYKASKIPKNFNSFYVSKIEEYLTAFESLFEAAQTKSDFQFIQTLLRFRGIQSSGWDTYRNTVDTFDYVHTVMQKQRDSDLKLNVFLWLYGHIIEASEPYEIIANLIDITKGGSYKITNFPRKKTNNGYRNQYPSEKIVEIERLCQNTPYTNIPIILKDVYDRELRNAIFHSDYSVYFGDIQMTGSEYPREIQNKEITKIINKGLAYHEVIKILHKQYTASYNKTETIPVSDHFSKDPDERAVVIVRKNHGVIGLKSNWSTEEIRTGKIDWYMGETHSYEYKMIGQGIYELPEDRVNKANRVLRALPSKPSKLLLPYIERYYINRGI